MSTLILSPLFLSGACILIAFFGVLRIIAAETNDGEARGVAQRRGALIFAVGLLAAYAVVGLMQ